MTKHFIRVWREVDIGEMENHLLVVGHLRSDCANCKELGLDLSEKKCPKCGTEFKYASTRVTGEHKFSTLIKIKNKRPDLICVDFDDFKRMSGKSKAQQFFKRGENTDES